MAMMRIDPMLENRDIIIIGLQPWYYEIGSNCKNIALQLSKHNRVLYVDLPINRKTFYSNDPNPGIQDHCAVIREKKQNIHLVENNLWELFPTSLVESINWLPSTALFKWVNRINNKRFANDIKKACRELHFRNVILFNDNDFFNGYDLKKFFQPSLYVYYCRDYLRGHNYWKKHGDTLEPQLIAKADLAVANSAYLAGYCSEHNKNSHYIGQGCDLENFDSGVKRQKPLDLTTISSPVIGYVGAVISYRLDENIIRIIAEADPAWQVVLVGPEDEVFQKSKLHQLPNVHFLGRKPMNELPSYIAHFDVCINPQLLSPITIGNYPLKVDEYLAMGKPVVATNTKTMEMFGDHTYLAGQPSDYPDLIRRALRENNDDLKNKRTAYARTHTWENSVEKLAKAVEEREKIIADKSIAH